MSNPKKLPGGNVIDLVRVWETYSEEEASISKCVEIRVCRVCLGTNQEADQVNSFEQCAKNISQFYVGDKKDLTPQVSGVVCRAGCGVVGCGLWRCEPCISAVLQHQLQRVFT